jgi:hypothetical protein
MAARADSSLARGRKKGAKRGVAKRGVRPLIIDSWLPSSESRYGYRAMARKLGLGYLRGALSLGQLPRRPDFGLAFLIAEKMLPFDHGLRDAGAGISCPVRPGTSVSAGLWRFAVSSARPNQQSAARPHLSRFARRELEFLLRERNRIGSIDENLMEVVVAAVLDNPQRKREDCWVYDVVGADGTVKGTVTNPISQDGKGGYYEGKPTFVPPGVDIYSNAETARWMNPMSFYQSVRAGGIWNFKSGRTSSASDYRAVWEPYGNFHFGFVGRAGGYSSYWLHAGAGYVSENHSEAAGRKVGFKVSQGIPSSLGPSVSFDPGEAPFYDSWFDYRLVGAGIQFYNDNFSSWTFTGFATQKAGADRLVPRPCNDSEFQVFVAAPGGRSQ